MAGAAGGGPGACGARVVQPAADVTAALAAALAAASGATTATAPGVDAAQTPAGRVYLGPGTYGLAELEVPSNVHLELDPGATIVALARAKHVFRLGTAGHVSNISISAGDGCGGRGLGRSAMGSTITTTGFRHGDPTKPHTWPGDRPTITLANAPIPYDPSWPVADMFVVDVDPRATGADVLVDAFWIEDATDVRIAHVFTIENAERYASDDPSTPSTDEAHMLAPKAASRRAAMMFEPVDGATVSDRDRAAVPRRIHVSYHYNINAPPGQGSNQVRSCIDCTFDRVFSHGGVPLRFETDGVRTVCPRNDCSCDAGVTGPVMADGSLQGFLTFGVVDGVVASNIVGVLGNAAVLANPHCLTNGTVEVSGVLAVSDKYALSTSAPRSGGPGAPSGGVGTFQSFTVRDLTAFAGDQAENRTTQGTSGVPGGWRGFDLIPSVAAIGYPNQPFPLALAGTLCWPPPLADGELASVAGTYTLTHSGCATTLP